MTTLPLDDPRTYEMLARGDSIGVFQFESEGMREALQEGAPRRVQRPRRAQRALPARARWTRSRSTPRASTDPRAISYPDERLRPILESSKGVILYQEQAMQISKELAGFSGAKADDLRKAIGKKNREAMAALKPEFVEGCRASGTSAEVIEFLWQTNEKSADYSFNKTHAACYALIAYRTAWLKANYTAEYMAALISSVMSTKDKVPFFVARCEEMGIEILPPDVNLSDHEFTVEGGRVGNIRFGLDAVKGVGYQAVEAIKRARDEGGDVHLAVGLLRARGQPHGQQEGDRGADQVRRARLDRREPQGHARGARAGAGGRPEDPAGRADRPGLDLRPPRRSARRPRPERRAAAGLRRPIHPPIPAEEFEQAELLAAEKEAIGLFVSAHPLKPLREALRARVDCSLSALADRRDKDWVTVGGIITEAKRIRTRNGDHMMFATLDDLEGAVEMLVFGKALAEHEAALTVDEVVLVKGRVDHKEAGKTCLVVQTVEPFAPSRGGDRAGPRRGRRGRRARRRTLAQPVHLRVSADCLSSGAIDELKHAIEDFPGPAEVLLEIDTSAGTRRLRLGEAYRVQHTPTLRAELEHALAPVVAASATG